MAFEGLSERLEAAFKRLKSKGSLNEADVRAAMRDVRMALLEADVSYKVAKDFTAKVTERAIGADVMESLTPAQMVIKIVNEELIDLMGGTKTRLATAAHPPTVIMLCGLQGAGKTTHCAKLALMLKNRGSRPMLVACDIYRPAAIKQLQVLGEKVGVPVFEKGTQDPVETAKQAVALAKDEGNDYVLIDTAGRLHIDEQLMDELKRIKSEVRPHEILLVVDAMTGQDAVNVASTFNETLGIDGLILTKLDVLSLIEKAETAIDEKKAAELEEKIRKNKFDLNDLLDQITQLRKMGSIQDTLAMLPGMGKKLQGVDVDEKQFDRLQALIRSMTPKERENPDIINPSRKRRIAAGSGQKVEDVNRLLNQHKQMQKLFKQFNGKGSKKKMRRMGFDPSKLGM